MFGATKALATAQEAHDCVNEVTWGQLADKVILTPDAVTEEMLTAAVQMTGKGGKVQVFDRHLVVSHVVVTAIVSPDPRRRDRRWPAVELPKAHQPLAFLIG